MTTNDPCPHSCKPCINRKDVNDKANARLIAAAPQMLEALEKIAEIGRQKGDATRQHAVSCFLIAEAAIRAAKGEV